MLINALVSAAFLLSFVAGLRATPVELAVLGEDNHVHFQCRYHGKTLVTAQHLGVSTSRGTWLIQNCTLSHRGEVHDDYKMYTGGWKSRSYRHNLYSYACSTNGSTSLDVDVRIARDGCAYRLHLPRGQYKVFGETSQWKLAADGDMFAQEKVEKGFQEEWKRFKTSEANGNSSFPRTSLQFPVLFDVGKASSEAYVMLTEADLDGRYSGSQLKHEYGSLVYHHELYDQEPAKVHGPITTPWRVAILGNLTTVFESRLDRDLSPPSALNESDTAWIRPGVSSWSWLAEHESGGNYTRQKAYVDLAKRENWSYVTLDNGFPMNATSWVPDLIQYANRHHVGVFLWYESLHFKTREQMERTLNQAQKWGAVGVKIDHFNSDNQTVHQMHDAILQATAFRKLMVNLHGGPIPRGRQRTYPHYLTAEAVRGDESMANDLRDVIVPYTRNVVGSMDYTPGLYTVTNRYYENGSYVEGSAKDQVEELANCTVGCHLAMAIAYESGIQTIAEIPEKLKKYNWAAAMLKGLPASWDSSTLLSGSKVGETFFVGRYKKKTNRHYFAGLIKGESKQVRIPFSSLGDGLWTVEILHDGKNRTSLDRKKVRNMTHTSEATIDLERNGGFAAVACQDREGCLADE